MLRKIGEAVRKWPNGLHVFIFPKIMIPMWGRLLFKVDDLVVYDSPGGKFWSFSMHKLFVLVFFFIHSSHIDLGG